MLARFAPSSRALGHSHARTRRWLWGLLCFALGCTNQNQTTLDAPTDDSDEVPLLDTDDPGNAELSISQAQFDAAKLGPGETPDSPDTTGGAWRGLEVPGISLIHSPTGWLSLWTQVLGDGKNPSGYRSALYRSRDGVHWVSIPLEPQHDDLRLTRLVYGAGRYLMVGERFSEQGGEVVWTSVDAEHWKERILPPSMTTPWLELSYARHRFFTFAFERLGISETGRDWQVQPSVLLQGGAAAYGNGVYLLTGNGPMLTSADGWSWQEQDLDCSLPEACWDGPEHQGSHADPFFAEGRFYSGVLSSPDGATWASDPARSAGGYVSGHFLGYTERTLAAWVSGGDVQKLRVVRAPRYAVGAGGLQSVGLDLGKDGPPPESVDLSFEDGLTCETAACFTFGRELFLVPPLGTPPLPDRVPRGADAAPLLNEFAQCPVSGQIFCDDYDARIGCVCRPEAPQTPDSCGDVSEYRCAGQFTARANEQPFYATAQGGCSCDAVDPNQPTGFGTPCDGGDACPAQFECLRVQPSPVVASPTGLQICTSRCSTDLDCPSWQATGFCAGFVQLSCYDGVCQPRTCH
jgi:hypothetical protein